MQIAPRAQGVAAPVASASSAATTPAPRLSERDATAEQIRQLAAEVRPRDAAVSVLLDRLADAIRQRKHEEARGYAGAIDPHAIASLLFERHSLIWGVFEVARNVLVFAPIAVTWFGLSTATDAYARLMVDRPDLVTRPFLLLWQESFGQAGVLNFSTLALIDASLIALLIVLSFVIHVRSDLRDAATRTRLLLKESEVRSLMGHAQGLAMSDIDHAQADELLDQMIAEERRIYERAMEREQRLFDLEAAIGDLRRTAEELARAVEALSDRAGAARRSRSREKEAAGPGGALPPGRSSVEKEAAGPGGALPPGRSSAE